MLDNLETNRLAIERLSISDTHFILALLNTPGWLTFIGERNVKSISDAEGYINKILLNDNFKYWVVRTKSENIPIGVITFIKRAYLENHDIGFAFLPAHSGKGYAYEAAAALLKEVAGSHDRILATTIKNNVRSIALLQKLGLKFVEEIKVEHEPISLFSISADKINVDNVTKSFFSIFTNKGNKEPQWDLISELCLPQTIIIKKTGVAQEVYDLHSFVAPRIKILSDGTLMGFEERETKEETFISGHIAQRYCIYEKSGVLNGSPFDGSGTKFFQFVKTIAGWKISAVVWEDE